MPDTWHTATVTIHVTAAPRVYAGPNQTLFLSGSGTATATLVSPREFFREALRYGAVSALAFHNHPSGDPTPSREDCALTTRLRAAGESLGVPLADHMVIGAESWHSFRAAEGWDTLRG